VTLFDTTIGNLLSGITETAKNSPYKRAVVCPESGNRDGRLAYTHLTFRQLDQESDCIAAGLATAGIVRGTRTILALRPCLDFFSLSAALLKIGAIPVIVDPGMGINPMLQCIRDTRPEAFIGMPWTRFLKFLRPGFFKGLKTFIIVGKRLLWGGLTMDDIRKIPWISQPPVNPQPDDTAAILLTPGNTGPAKGVVHTHGNLAARIRMIKDRFDIAPDEIDLITVPAFAFFGPALGLTSVIPDMDPARPALVRPENIIQIIIDQGVTNLFASPALLDRVGQHARNYKITFPSLKRVISMGAPLSTVCMERFAKTLPPAAELHVSYGALEAMPVMSIGSAEILSETKELSVKGYGECIGRPVGDMDVRLIPITDDPVDGLPDDLPFPQGEIGELIVKGDPVSESYLENPDLDTLQKIRENHDTWHRMGDLGWMDKNNRFWFCGRKSHRVITEKGTLYPIPCEAIFNAHPDVCRSALVGIGPPENKTPVLCVELEQSDALDQKRIETELLTLAEQNVITQGITTILFHKQLPMDARHQAKINREELAIWATKQRK